MLKIRRSHDRLIFNMGIPVPGKMVFVLKWGPVSLPISATTAGFNCMGEEAGSAEELVPVIIKHGRYWHIFHIDAWECCPGGLYWGYIDGLMQERRNSIAKALELCLSCNASTSTMLVPCLLSQVTATQVVRILSQELEGGQGHHF